MPRLEARLETDRASRYLVQFCRHATAMGGRAHPAPTHQHGSAPVEVEVSADWSATEGLVTFGPWGRCSLRADESTLTLQIVAADEDGLGRIREIVTRDVDRFTWRAPAPLTWRAPDRSGSAPPFATDPPAGPQDAPRRRGDGTAGGSA